MADPFSFYTNIPQDLRVKRRMADNTVIDFYEETKAEEYSQEGDFLGKSVEAKNLRWLTAILIFGFILLVFRAYYLQAQKGDYYGSAAEGNRIRRFVIPAARGIIFDKNGGLLVRNIPRFAVYLTIADLPSQDSERKTALASLASLISMDINEIETIIKKQEERKMIYQPVSVKDNLDYNQALALKISVKELAGINLEVSQQREYLGGNDFSAILGYVGKINEDEYEQKKDQGYLLNDIIGKTGIEYAYENKLRGVNGFEEVEVNALGKRKKTIAVQKAIAGSNLYLTIDKELQDKIAAIMSAVIKKESKSRASVVILNPNSGEVIALLSLPDYDNNLFAKGISEVEYQKLIDNPDQPLFFRAIAGEYPSGSTIKPVWSAVALQEGIIKPNTTILSNGGIHIGEWFFPDWKAGGHGLTDVKKALAESVNTFYYYIGGGYGDFKGLGIEKMMEYSLLFNIGATTGIDLPGEQSGFFPSPQWKKEHKDEVWYIGDTYHVSIGQGDLLVTPLQVANWTAFFANGGKIIKPHLVSKIESNGNVIEISPEVVRKNFISDEYIKIIKDGMRRGVTQGSSRALADLPITVCGKTGTAQWHTNKDEHAWWTGFSPCDNPQIVITVLVEEGREGSAVAVPIAKEILKWWWERMNNE